MARIAVLTSGGDSPGMNAFLRGAVKVAAAQGVHVVGVRDGYEGLMDGSFEPLTVQDGESVRPAPAFEARPHRRHGRHGARLSALDALPRACRSLAGGRSGSPRWTASSWWAATARSPARTCWRNEHGIKVMGVPAQHRQRHRLHLDLPRRRHRAQHHRSSLRPHRRHRPCPQARLRGGGDGPRLRLPRHGQRHRRRRRRRAHPRAGPRGVGDRRTPP